MSKRGNNEQSRNQKRKALYAAKAKESDKEHRNRALMEALGDSTRVHVIKLDREDRKALRMKERVYIEPMKV